MITLGNIVPLLLCEDVIVQAYSYNSKKYWKLTKPLTIQLSNGFIISIPKGFKYDMATVPRWLWSISRPFNDGLIGFLIHDYLYIHKEKHNMSRLDSDRELLIWIKKTNPRSIDNYVKYFFVRVFGWIWWNF